MENRDGYKWIERFTEKTDWRGSEDGYSICTRSVFRILRSAGIKMLINEEGEEMPIYLYDDWYPCILEKEDARTYSLFKVREPGDEQGAAGTAVPFVALDAAAFDQVLEAADPVAIYQCLYRVTNPHPKNISRELTRYFADPRSEGSYLIAEWVVEKVSRIVFRGGEHTWKLGPSYEANDKWARAFLTELEAEGIYDREQNSITVLDPKNLTDLEKNAVLVCTTGNVDVYSFAGENLWHAMLCRDEEVDAEARSVLAAGVHGAFLKFAGNFLKQHTIASDAGVGEDPVGFLYEGYFKSKQSQIYREQKALHAEEGENA